MHLLPVTTPGSISGASKTYFSLKKEKKKEKKSKIAIWPQSETQLLQKSKYIFLKALAREKHKNFLILEALRAEVVSALQSTGIISGMLPFQHPRRRAEQEFVPRGAAHSTGRERRGSPEQTGAELWFAGFW